MLGAISVKSTDPTYYEAISKQIVYYFTSGGGRLKFQGGAIPLLDAYYYYSQASGHDVKSPEEFLRACELLIEANVEQNGVFIKSVDGQKVLAGSTYKITITITITIVYCYYSYFVHSHS